jgi:hypothetical protein
MQRERCLDPEMCKRESSMRERERERERETVREREIKLNKISKWLSYSVRHKCLDIIKYFYFGQCLVHPLRALLRVY